MGKKNQRKEEEAILAFNRAFKCHNGVELYYIQTSLYNIMDGTYFEQ